MKSALLTKAALCICPPAIIATSAVTVPPVRKAVHHIVASREPRAAAPAAAVPCAPVVAYPAIVAPPPPVAEGPLALSAVPQGPIGPQVAPPPLLTNIGPGLIPSGGTVGPIGPIGPGVPNGPGIPGAVPEPATWLMMLSGFGFIGAALRRSSARARAGALPEGGTVAGRRRRRRRRGVLASLGAGIAGWGSGLSSGTASAPAGAATASAMAAKAGAHSAKAALLAKAAMCVCPPVAMMVGATSVPAVRHAVYTATAPVIPGTRAPSVIALVTPPCVPAAATAIAAAPGMFGSEVAVLPETPAWPIEQAIASPLPTA